jgi:hypothetical protein
LRRWWIIRSELLHKHLLLSKSLIWFLSVVTDEPAFHRLHHRVKRYVILSFALVFICAQTADTHPAPAFNQLLTDRLLRADELPALAGLSEDSNFAEIMDRLVSASAQKAGHVSFDLARVPWFWIAQHIYVLVKMRRLTPPQYILMHSYINEAQKIMDTMEMYLNVRLPFPYAHVITLLVNITCIATAATAGLQLAITNSLTAMFCIFSFTCLVIGVFLGLLALAAVIADPFGEDIADFPFEYLQANLASSVSVYTQAKIPRETLSGLLEPASRRTIDAARNRW